MKRKRTLWSMLLVSLMLTSCSIQEEKKTVDAVSVKTETVSLGNASEQGTTYVGEVEAESSTAVSFTGSGTVMRLCVSEGQTVSKGQLIAELDKTQSQNLLHAAEAMMTQARDAEARMRQLHENNTLPDMKWVEVQSQVQQAEAQLAMAKKSLEDCRLTAPCSGVVGSKMLEAGMTALPAQPVCNILNIKKVKVRISVPEKHIANIAGKALVCVESLGNACFESEGFEKGVTADAISRTYEMRYLLDNADGQLLPGMVCNVQVCEPSIPTITLPITSVQKSANGEMFVWKKVHETVHRTPVLVGKAHGNRISIVQGVKEGDVIVVKGYQKLSEGVKVKEG